MSHDLGKVVAGLPPAWAGFLTDWDRSLRAGNYPQTTRYNYLLAAAQLARYVAGQTDDADGEGSAVTPTAVSRRHIEAFQAWMIESRSAALCVKI